MKWKHSVPSGKCKILDLFSCAVYQSETTFLCYKGSWVLKFCKYDECDEDNYYEVINTFCQADLYQSEYIQQNR